MHAVVTGTTLAPFVELEFAATDLHASTGAPLTEWVRGLPGREFRPDRRRWVVTSFGADPAVALTRAGFRPVDRYGDETSVADLARPVAVPAPGDRDGAWRLYPRLAGPDVALAVLPVEAHWCASDGCWLVDPRLLADADWVDAPTPVPAPAQRPARGAVPLRFDGTMEGLAGVPVTDLGCVNSTTAEALAGAGIGDVAALLDHLPRRYLDLSRPVTVAESSTGDRVAVLARLTKVRRASKRGGMLSATAVDTGGTPIVLRWFNADWMAHRLTVGRPVVLFGTLEEFTGRFGAGHGMTNPLVEPVDANQGSGVIGIYPASGKHDLSTWAIRRAALEACERIPRVEDPVPADLVAGHGLPSRVDAYRMVHAPDSMRAAKLGRDRLAYDELLRLQVVLAVARARTAGQAAWAHDRDPRLVGDYIASLPFPLTGAQARCVGEILADMAAGRPMHRLLQGDVGAGKSATSFCAMFAAVGSGWQAALVAPTEILATQHHADLADAAAGVRKGDGAPVRVALLTNKTRAADRRTILAGLADGTIDLVVGTHALLGDDVEFAQLSCVVVDEQHRFGVEQRAALRGKGAGRVPDTLYATATPIPRTAAMTVFGDLDVSTLDEMPPGRAPVDTRWVTSADPGDAAAGPWAQVRAEVAAGRRAFVVCPAVHGSLAREAAGAHDTAAQLAAGALAGLAIGVVTGKDRPDDRAATMAAFSAGRLDVLVATTVIEVGVNVPAATVMVVLGADRFGLAQLHQLRGRVGRGKWPGACWLVADPDKKPGRERMEVLVSTSDGFVLAEHDLAARGAGSMSGSVQSGAATDLRVANILADTQLLGWAKEDASVIVGDDPGLGRWPLLRGEVETLIGDEGAENLRSA